MVFHSGFQVWENYVHVRKCARNMHVKIYDVHEMYVRAHNISYEPVIFEFHLTNKPIFCILGYRWFNVRFI